jgi:CBS domain containing-hemolysin-like protein
MGGTDSILHLLQELKKSDEAFAVVVDEYGAARGIVTAEDIMEEVVGDMNDEFEAEQQATQWVRKVSDQEYVVSGRMKLHTLKDRLGIKIRKGEFATLAGYLLEKAHEVPAQGTVIEAHGISYTILKRTDHLIQEIGISRKE